MNLKVWCAALICGVSVSAICAADLPFDKIVNAASHPQEWLTYWGDYHATRYRDLNQIDDANVDRLRLQWIFQTGVPGAFETVPLVLDGIMYFTANNSSAYAIDARSGRELWRFQYTIPKDARPCCGTLNRGLAMIGSRLFMATPDAHLVAIDSRNGRLLWDSEIIPANGIYGASMAPLAFKDKVVVGVAGGEKGNRGLIDAYDAATGKRAWRFWTIPAKGEPGNETWGGDSWKHGGAPTWMTGTYDPELNTVYWGVGNPGPDLYGDVRPGDNLYSDSVVALDGDTGKLKWHFQFTPHDVYDWDAAETPMLLDLPWNGKPRKLLVQANRNAFFYVLDRVTGEFLMAKPFARQTWAKDIDSKGRPVKNPGVEPSAEGTRVCPQSAGAANWMAPSYSPATGLFYFNVREGCDVYYSSPPVYEEGKGFWGSIFRGETGERQWGRVTALDPLTAKTKWTYKLYQAPWAGTLATSGNLLFAGDEDGYLMAFNAKTGELLWKINTGNRLATSPITFELDGKQYIAMPSGSVLLAFALPDEVVAGKKK
ncbi:MAG TPA: PQQ-dependent dehydrogenase, methanol/ethanol family [Bryobacteraceae bacterium]|nr:PQQ-dependent dehydrogenase, methanol/ethanol family [Bryobacteraceae bacterium]